MKQSDAVKKMTEFAITQPTQLLKESIIKLNDDLSENATFVLGVLLDVIETRLSEKEYIELCESL